MPTCYFSREIQDLLDDRCEEDRRTHLEAHLNQCDSCQRELAALRWVQNSIDGMGTDVDRGTIEVGKRADLVMLDADPLQNIANTRRIAGVFVSGQWADRSRLDSMLEGLAQRYAGGNP